MVRIDDGMIKNPKFVRMPTEMIVQSIDCGNTVMLANTPLKKSTQLERKMKDKVENISQLIT